jgi:hypothetical protein
MHMVKAQNVTEYHEFLAPLVKEKFKETIGQMFLCLASWQLPCTVNIITARQACDLCPPSFSFPKQA